MQVKDAPWIFSSVCTLKDFQLQNIKIVSVIFETHLEWYINKLYYLAVWIWLKNMNFNMIINV